MLTTILISCGWTPTDWAVSREAREPQRRLCGISDFTQASEEKGPLCEDPRANTP
jgi:hypothetical protein